MADSVNPAIIFDVVDCPVSQAVEQIALADHDAFDEDFRHGDFGDTPSLAGWRQYGAWISRRLACN